MFRILCNILIITASLCLLQTAEAQGGCQDLHVLKSMANIRSEPNTDSVNIGAVVRNTSLACLEEKGGWIRILQAGGLKGWIRGDLVSRVVVRIHKHEQRLVVTEGGRDALVMPITPGKRLLEDGRYFVSPGSGILNISWPNRRDLRLALQTGVMTYQAYKNAIMAGPENMVGSQLAICRAGNLNPTCGVFLAPNDYKDLTTMIPGGARLEIYAEEKEDLQRRQPDDLSRQILLGALEQLKYPAAGLQPGGNPPQLAYPGGDIQPDFASSPDIIIRAVRYAGADLQALVHEDTLLHPKRYEGLNLGDDFAASHRLVPVLQTYFMHNALSLPTDSATDPFSFEAGDIVIFSTGEAGPQTPDRAGILSETFDRLGLPLVITVWDLGQSTGKKKLLGRDSPKVTGHFRMTHLFDYQ